jgi:hypothetical protein
MLASGLMVSPSCGLLVWVWDAWAVERRTGSKANYDHAMGDEQVFGIGVNAFR